MICALSMRMMRVDYQSGSSELRSAISQDWLRFARFFPEMTFVPAPNMGGATAGWLKNLRVSAMILTGGEDIGLFPERDKTECAMLGYALVRKLPVLGVCRGAQLLNRHFGGADAAVSGHAAVRHNVQLTAGVLPEVNENIQEVNSYHNLGILSLGENLRLLAAAEDGAPEAFFHVSLPVIGVMWHPEREAVLTGLDAAIMDKFFKYAADAAEKG